MLPRHFVVYVKQRLVLLDLLFYVLELFQVVIEVVAAARAIAALGGNQAVSGSIQAQTRAPATEDYQRAVMAQPADRRAITVAVLGRPEVQDALVQAADLSGSDLAVTSRNQAFRRQVEQIDQTLMFEFADPAERRRAALGQVADAYAAEYPDYQVMQLLAAAQPAEQALAVVDKLAVGRAAERQATLADDLMGDGPRVFADNGARSLYADVRADMGERKVSDYVPEAGIDLTAREVLARSPAEAEAVLGRERYERFREAFVKDRAVATEGAEVLGKGVPEAVAVKVEAEIRSGATPQAAIEKVKADASVVSEAKPLLDQAAELLRVSGGGPQVLQRIRRTP
jgi:hypothetical protein